MGEVKYFDPYSIFARLDGGDHGYLTLLEIQNFLYDNTIQISRREAAVIFDAMDINHEGAISFTTYFVISLI